MNVWSQYLEYITFISTNMNPKYERILSLEHKVIFRTEGF